MATRKRPVKVDENETDRAARNRLVKNDDAPRATRRAALGDVGNRVLRPSVNSVKEAQSKLPDLKNVKPKVDTHWKKSEAVGKLKNQVEQKKKVEKIPCAAPKYTKVNVVKVVFDKAPKSPTLAPLAKPEPDFRDEVEEEDVAGSSYSNDLVSQVVDIDADDHENLLHMTEYVNDIFDYMGTLEHKYPIERDFLANHVDIRPRMRTVLIDWINEVHYECRLVPETYHMAVSLIDRYLQATKNISRKLLQLVGITGLFLASKYEEVCPPSIFDFVHFADNAYTDGQVRQMEMNILHKLDFNMGRPLPIQFLRRFSKAAAATETIHGVAKYFTEVISMEYTMVHLNPSKVAAVSIYLALRLFRQSDDVWTPTLQHYTKYQENQLTTVAKDLATLVLEAPTSKFRSVYKKYADKKMGAVAKLPELQRGAIKKIALAD
uniref:Uncharacterized protein n=1 Tax=Phlebotomus papatasi TaxID=29031 RepID=A0A1B0GPE0_PHLPP